MDLNKKLQGFQLIAQEKLQSIICSLPGKKDLIIEPSLIKPLEHVCSASWLKLKGIQRIFKFEKNNAISRSADQVQVFMLRSRIEDIQHAMRSIRLTEKSLNSLNTETDFAIKHYHIICVPSCFSYFHQLLEHEGLYGIIQLHHYSFDFINIDEGILCLELTDVFSSVFLHGDTSMLPSIARSIRVLQMICGSPEIVLTYGENAANLMKVLNSLGNWKTNSCGGTVVPTLPSDLSTLIIFDRAKDFASALLTPAIYAGLLQEVFHNCGGEMKLIAENNKIRVQKIDLFYMDPRSNEASKPASAPVSALSGNNKPQVIRLSSLNDEIYNENRYKHFAQASSMIRAQAKAIGIEVQKLGDMKLEEMHEYVARKLPKITELKSKVLRHMKACEIVIEMLATNFRRLQSLEGDILNNNSYKRILAEIDELLTTDGQKFNSLRLLCLLHSCAGISIDDLTQFIRNYCNLFGFDKLDVFPLLARAGLLPSPNDMSTTEASVVSKKISGASATKLLSNISIPKTFHQTPFQANANRMRLLLAAEDCESSSGSTERETDNQSSSKTGPALKACPSYVFNGLYVPFVSQICNFLLKATNADELNLKLGSIEGLQIHVAQASTTSLYTDPISVKSYCDAMKQNEVKNILPIRKRGAVLVYILGGMTYAEIAACNLIEQLTGTQIIVASDLIVAGSDLISCAFG